ncbi:MAG: hypothetical protein ACLFV5_00690 [Anaerolineales bacterium]
MEKSVRNKKERPPIDPDAERPGPQAQEELLGLEEEIPVHGLDEN